MLISYLADRPEFIQALAPEILEHWRHILTDETIERREAKLREHMNKCALPIALVAHHDGQVFGTAALRAFDLEGYEHLSPWLGGVFVRRPYRGCGIASQLSHAIEQQAWSLGYSTLYLFTPDQQHLYSRIGWSRFERAVWHGIAADIMVKEKG